MTQARSRSQISGPASAQPAPANNEVLAAVDLGSNSFHMKVARFEAGQLVVIDRLREMVRLAAGLDKDGHISKVSQQRALECLARFGQRIRDMHADTVRVVATNTFRKARKAGKFKRRAEKILGHPIEIVSGREEARLVYSGVAHSSPMHAERLLVVDIGGGSTELIVGEGFNPSELFSLQMGCVSISRKCFGGGRMSRKRLKKARMMARVELEPVTAPLRKWSWEEAIGASGTVRAAAQVIALEESAGRGLTLAGLERLSEKLVSFGHLDAVRLPGLDPERAPVFPGGIIILETVFRELGISSMRVSDGALREGILFDLVGRFSREDARERTIRSLQERYNVDQEQAAQVEATALALFNALAKRWHLDTSQSESMLCWAARTHELGLAIAHAGYHRHGAYLLANSDLPGFSTLEQRNLAALVALQRKRFAPEELAVVHPDSRETVRRLAVILRLAVLLHRGRGSAGTPAFAVRASKKKLRLQFAAGWLESHPLTLADLEGEASYLRAAGLLLETA